MDSRKSAILAIIDEMTEELELLRKYVIVLAEEKNGEQSRDSEEGKK